MRISEKFNLEKTQRELDFVDIDTDEDYPLFIDPYFLSVRNDAWSYEATSSIKSFFQTVVDLLMSGREDEAKYLFLHLSEPNETCLGVSKGKPKGRGVGGEEASEIFDSIIKSGAIESGLVSDLQDCIVFVDGIGPDKLSDMTTNIIRQHLIEYTQSQCRLWGIPMMKDVPSGFVWDRESKSWDHYLTDMLVVDNKKILLVPKGIVSYSKLYTSDKFHQHFILTFLKKEYLKIDSPIVNKKKRKNGELYITKKEIKEKVAPFTKEYIREFTSKYPKVFEDFKNSSMRFSKSLDHDEFKEVDSEFELDSFVDYLINKLTKIPTGGKDASAYHRLVVGIMDFIFYPNLSCPQVEKEIHDGRKRIDLTFDNSARNGFFYNLHTIHKTPSQYIFVECKNYSDDPKNPELDQLSGRFSFNRGQFGFLLCRNISDMQLFLKRSTDTYRDGRGIIIPMTDHDLIFILSQLKQGIDRPEEKLLTDRLRDIILV